MYMYVIHTQYMFALVYLHVAAELYRFRVSAALVAAEDSAAERIEHIAVLTFECVCMKKHETCAHV